MLVPEQVGIIVFVFYSGYVYDTYFLREETLYIVFNTFDRYIIEYL